MNNNKKGGLKSMEHKDIWLVLGLTVVLAVAVSLSTVSITGDAIFGKKVTMQKAPVVNTNVKLSTNCKFINFDQLQAYYGENVYGKTGKNGYGACEDLISTDYSCASVTYRIDHFVFDDTTCKKIKYIDKYYQPFDASYCDKTIGGGIGSFSCQPQIHYVNTNNEQRFGASEASYYYGVLCCKSSI